MEKKILCSQSKTTTTPKESFHTESWSSDHLWTPITNTTKALEDHNNLGKPIPIVPEKTCRSSWKTNTNTNTNRLGRTVPIIMGKNRCQS